jgi:hypothetical protein
MTGQADTQPMVFDPLLASAELPLRAVLYPLGFPLEIQTNSERVIEAARESWSQFEQEFDTRPVRLAIGVAESGDTQGIVKPPVFRSREHLLTIVLDSDNFLSCDLVGGFAFGWLSPAVLADIAALRYFFLEAAVLVLVDQLYLAPVHGALVVRNGQGVLLCGDSHAGKSTLAYACARAGWTFVSDDCAYLSRHRTDRYGIGNPHGIRLRDGARRLFPELADRLVLKRPNGKVGIEIPTNELGIATALGSEIHHMVFLNRKGPPSPRLAVFSKSEAADWLEMHTHYGVDLVKQERREAYRRLLKAGVWQLEYSNLDQAITRLEDLVVNGA